MINKQLFCVLIGILLFVGCSKPKLEVLAGKEGANFILTAYPKDVKISFFKKDLKKEAGKQLEEVDFVLQGKSIEMNLLGNPLYMKLELGIDYFYRIEKEGLVTEEGDVNLKLGENLEKAIILYTEDELMSQKEENWSEYLGTTVWHDAKRICEEVSGRRLPTLLELNAAYNSGITESWQRDGRTYWSSTEKNIFSYWLIDIYDGNTYIDRISLIGKDNSRYHAVRCRR